MSSPSMLHEGVIALVRDEPAFAASLLRDLLNVEVPRFDEAQLMEGKAEGEAKALLKILQRRGMAVTDEQQRQIVACTDLPTRGEPGSRRRRRRRRARAGSASCARRARTRSRARPRRPPCARSRAGRDPLRGAAPRPDRGSPRGTHRSRAVAVHRDSRRANPAQMHSCGTIGQLDNRYPKVPAGIWTMRICDHEISRATRRRRGFKRERIVVTAARSLPVLHRGSRRANPGQVHAVWAIALSITGTRRFQSGFPDNTYQRQGDSARHAWRALCSGDRHAQKHDVPRSPWMLLERS